MEIHGTLTTHNAQGKSVHIVDCPDNNKNT